MQTIIPSLTGGFDVHNKNQMSTKRKPVKKNSPVKGKTTVHRRDWEHHQQIISSAFFKIVETKKKMPTRVELARETKLSISSIDRHLKMPTFKKNCENLRAIQDKMLIQFANKVMKSSNPSMWDLYFELTEKEYVKNRRVEVTGEGGGPVTMSSIAPPPWLKPNAGKPKSDLSQEASE